MRGRAYFVRRAVQAGTAKLMKKSTGLACVVVVAASAWLARHAFINEPDFRVGGMLRALADLSMRNLVVIHVDPAGREARSIFTAF